MESLKNFFHYTRPERNGALVLILLCIALALAPRLIPLFSPAETVDFSADLAIVDSLALLEDAGTADPAASAGLFPFDPNTASKEELMRLGLRERTASSIVNYRSKGGQFRKKEDLQKIYTLSEEEYLRLAPYIRIAGAATEAVAAKRSYTLFPFDPNTATEAELRDLGLPENVVRAITRFREKGGKYRRKEDLQKIYTLSEADYRRIEPYIAIASQGSIPTIALDVPKAYDAPETVNIDINRAGEEEWQRLRGIGPAYSARIVKFREALGGFASVEQVAETRGLPDSTFQRIRLQLRPSPIFRPLPINTISAEALATHPYIDRRSAEALVAYRNNHGPFRHADDLRKVYALKAEVLDKLMPYLVFD